MNEPISIGRVSAKPGSKAFGYLEVAERPGSTVWMPVGIVNGSKLGPILCITAGKHAVEYAGIDAAIRLFKETKAEELGGALLTVPVANIPSFDTQTPFVCSVDNKDVAYLLPGNSSGSMSHRIAYTLVENVIKKADFYVDLHGGDLPEWIVDWTIYMVTGKDEVDKQSEIIARLFGTGFIERTTRPIINIGKGIPAILGEVGSLGRYEDSDVLKHINGVRNVMRYLGMIEGKPTPPGRQLIFRTKMPERALDSTESAGLEILNTNRGGLLYLKVKPGDHVEAGQVLGEVRDLKGDIAEEIRSPSSLTVLMIYPKHVVASGDPVFCGAPTMELPPLDSAQVRI